MEIRDTPYKRTFVQKHIIYNLHNNSNNNNNNSATHVYLYNNKTIWNVSLKTENEKCTYLMVNSRACFDDEKITMYKYAQR